MTYEIFICYKRYSGDDFAERLKNALAENSISAFIDIKDIPNEFKSKEKWFQCRDQAIKNCTTFLMIVTAGFESSPEVIKEIKLAKNYDRTFMIFRWKNLEKDIIINLGDELFQLKDFQQIPFSTTGELVREFYDKYPSILKEFHLQLPVTGSNKPKLKRKLSPLVHYQITQRIQNTNFRRSLPDVGFRIRQWNDYPIKARVKARAILDGKDLGLIKGGMRMGKLLGYYNGLTDWNLNPYVEVFGHFTFPEINEKSKSFTIEVTVSIQDLSGKAFEFLPVAWTYAKINNDWFYEPTGV